ncbi:MAG: gliding motility-associated C-terminal domain-containing protein [Pedobacter sp.]|uniref:T9SS type B sorting domain-containing protein n=1 Tax=Pedobacter sp. TaxID=1411316 RepID=UPI0028099B07|nr:gliding motility-associated C-terminal domain-containing protein [Pedobacter sp.]MDQ8005339.1 gliding motility-associated C-terminal domain-containing protein [Pedobacter sp.]
MRKLLFLMTCALAIFTTASAQFTAGNLAVYRYGDGTPMVNAGRVPVFIDEYNPVTGQRVRTITVSRTANGANFGLEGMGLTSGGTFEGEGFPVLSRNGETLSVIGYNPAQTGQFVIATINANGDVNTTTLVASEDAIGAPRSAVVEGNAVYFNGHSNGARYKLLGTTTASTRVSSSPINSPRVLTIADTYFSASNNGTKIFAPYASTNVPNAALPTTSVTFPTSPNIPGSAPLVSAHQVLAFRSATNRTLIYVLDDNGGAPLIKKYRSNASGSDWVQFGNVAVPVNTKSISGVYSNTGVTLYFTTYANPSAGNASQLYAFTNSFTPANEGETAANMTGSPVLLATASANTTFRGVTMAPVYGKVPSDLTANVISLNEVRLNWRDNSTTETGFEISRSTDNVNFSSLATVAQNVTTYTDNTVVAGTTYYYKVRGIEPGGPVVYSNTVNVTAGSGIITGINFSAQTIYENQAVGTTAGEFSVLPTSISNVTYTLIPGTGDTDNAKFQIVGNQLRTNALLDFETQAVYNVRVRATSPSNFSFEQTFQVTINDVNEKPTITVIGNQSTCAGTEEKVITLSGITAGPETGQTLTATISSNQPTAFQSLQVNLLAGGAGEIRYRLSANATGEPEISLTLTDNGGTANGGVDTHIETFKLRVFPFPTVTIVSDMGSSVDKGIAVRLTATGGTTYQWESNGSIVGATNIATITVRPQVNTTYRVVVSNEGGCASTTEFTLNVTDNYNLVTAANLVSPNGDGVNDFWVIKNIDLYPESVVRVFDKAGRVIFNKKGYQNDWDGRVAGSSLKEDTYYYIIDFGAGLPKKKGSLTMLNN